MIGLPDGGKERPEVASLMVVLRKYSKMQSGSRLRLEFCSFRYLALSVYIRSGQFYSRSSCDIGTEVQVRSVLF